MSMLTPLRRHLLRASLAAALVAVAASAGAQTPDPAATPPPASPEIDLNLVNLPTTMSLQRHKGYFRLTHRFVRDLRVGDFGSLAADLFALDNGAVIGLEYRFGITDNLQAGVHRTILSKTIQLFGRFDGWRQGTTLPVSLSVIGSIEGLNNMRDNHQPAIAAVVSRTIGSRVALYAMPAFVGNTRAADFLTDHDHDHDVGGELDEHSTHRHTALLGLGTRVRVRPTVYVAAEVSPRLAGHDPGRATWAVSAEKKTGGHLLALALTNSFGTTFGQLARGGSDHELRLGFNVIRKF
jgi:Membrane bound beta barrel domain (DUF5777)